MIHGHVCDFTLARNHDSIVAIAANLGTGAVWVAQVGLRIKGVKCIGVPGG